jgi:esterase/lipase superfamily enzyme
VAWSLVAALLAVAIGLGVTTSRMSDRLRSLQTSYEALRALFTRQGDYTVIDVFYATDRRPTGTNHAETYFGPSRGDGLLYGVCEVSLPPGHQTAELERPQVWKFEFREDPQKHVVLANITPEPKERFYGQLRAHLARSRRKTAFVFIHGFNTTFAEAARRTGQLAYDLRLDGPPILYSWPSVGSPFPWDYLADETAASWTTPHLVEFLTDVAAQLQVSTVHLIAHSLGNRPLTDALKVLAPKWSAGQGPRFRQVVLTAPDIDADIFRRDLAPELRGTAERVTLYASTKDLAMELSQAARRYPRAGDSGGGLVIVPGIDTVDASAVATDLGHSYYGDVRTVVEDLVLLLRDGLPPDRRLLDRKAKEGSAYWAFRP